MGFYGNLLEEKHEHFNKESRYWIGVGFDFRDVGGNSERRIKAAQTSGALWRLVDPATGGKAVPLQKLIKTAKTKLEAGDEAEAIRIANKVSWAADMGLSQAKDQETAKPYY